VNELTFFSVTNSQVTRYTVVCSAHFSTECFHQKKATHVGDRRYLKSAAIPTIFNWTSESKQRRSIVRHHGEAASANTDTDSEGTLTGSDTEIHDDRNDVAADDVKYGPQLPSTDELLSLLATRQLEIDCLQQKLAISRFGLERYSTDRDKIKFFTGFSDYRVLSCFFNWLVPAARQMSYPYSQKVAGAKLTSRRSLPLCDELFLLLCRVHGGLLEEDLADRFGISVATVSRIFIAWVNLLYFVLGSFNIWPSRECIDRCMPSAVKQKFPTVRVIIDCTEIFTQKPSSLIGNSQLYSSYKSHATFKCLIGIAPHGPVTFVSNLFSGSVSDVELTKVCGLLELLEPGDSVMADKGFTIAKLLEERECNLIIPHFLKSHGQFSSAEVAENDDITAIRVHVERAIRRVKENRIFQGIVPLSMLGSINQIWTVCCLLTNFRKRLF
jgi:hypothetical protein